MHHDFVLVKKNRINTKNRFNKMTSNYFDNNKESLPSIKIDDSIILYIFDSLKWVESEFYYREGIKQTGLNYHGVTIIRDENAQKFRDVLECWINLFSLGNDILELKGEYVFSDEIEYDELAEIHYAGGQYEKIKIEKELLIKQFKTLREFLEKTIELKEYCVIHLGI